MKALCWLTFYAILLMAAVKFLVVWQQAAAIGAVVLVVYVGARASRTDPQTKVLLTSIFGNTRETGPGLVIPLPDEWIATVNETEVQNVQEKTLEVKIEVEAENKEIATITLRVLYQIVDLVTHIRFSAKDLKESIESHTEAWATDFAHACKDMAEIYTKVRDNTFEGCLLLGFQESMPGSAVTVEAHHGIRVTKVVIANVEMPESIKEASLERLAAEKRAEALVAENKGLKKAAKVLQGRVPKGKKPSLSDEKAIELSQVQSGKSPKQIYQVEGEGGPLGGLIIALLNKFALQPKNNKKKGGP